MDNTQKETDFQILLNYVSHHPGATSPFTPDLMIRLALPYMDKISNAKTSIDIRKFNRNVYDLAQFKSQPCVISPETGELFRIVIYILLKMTESTNVYVHEFLAQLEQELINLEEAHFIPSEIEQVISRMQEYQRTAPKFYNPMEEIKEIAEGKNLTVVDWNHLLREMIKFSKATQADFPYFIILHSFLITIPAPSRRVDVIKYLQKAAPECFSNEETQQFLLEASWLISTYSRLSELLNKHPMPTIWKHDPDLNEFVLLMNAITPEEFIALSQAIIDTRESGKPYGILAHVLLIPKYIGKMVIDSGLQFCQGLYYAIGDKQWIQSGVGDFYTEMPTLDTQSIIFMDKCYQIFLNHRIDKLQEAYVKEHHHNKALSSYLWNIYKDFEYEYDECFTDGHLQVENAKAYQSLKARFEDLIAYTIKVEQIEEEKEDAERHNEKFVYIISDEEPEITKIHKRIEMYIFSPAQLRDELIRLQEEKLVSLPMDNPTAIIREIRRIWGNIAPKERSFVTTWGRRV